MKKESQRTGPGMMRRPAWGGPQAAAKRHSQPFSAKRLPHPRGGYQPTKPERRVFSVCCECTDPCLHISNLLSNSKMCSLFITRSKFTRLESRLRSRLGPTPGSVGPSRGVAVLASSHARDYRPRASDVSIVRGTPLGNPFPMECGDTRCGVCDAHELLLASGDEPSEVARRCGLVCTPRPHISGAGGRRRMLQRLDERLDAGESFRLVCVCAHAGRRCQR